MEGNTLRDKLKKTRASEAQDIMNKDIEEKGGITPVALDAFCYTVLDYADETKATVLKRYQTFRTDIDQVLHEYNIIVSMELPLNEDNAGEAFAKYEKEMLHLEPESSEKYLQFNADKEFLYNVIRNLGNMTRLAMGVVPSRKFFYEQRMINRVALDYVEELRGMRSNLEELKMELQNMKVTSEKLITYTEGKGVKGAKIVSLKDVHLFMRMKRWRARIDSIKQENSSWLQSPGLEKCVSDQVISDVMVKKMEEQVSKLKELKEQYYKTQNLELLKNYLNNAFEVAPDFVMRQIPENEREERMQLIGGKQAKSKQAKSRKARAVVTGLGQIFGRDLVAVAYPEVIRREQESAET